MKYLSALIIYLSLFLVFINSGCNKENPTENIPVQSTPVVSILYPVNTEIIGDSIQIQVSATDDKGVIKVEIYIDNQIPENGILINPPYNYTWKLGNYADSSSHTLFAKAFDGDNNVGSSSVLNLVSFKFAPTKLAAFFLSDSLIKLTWQDNSQKEMGYEIERKTNGENFELVKTVDANITEAEISGIYKIPDVFSFRIRAFNLNQKSRYSNIVSQTLHFPPPTNLSINSISATSLRIDWVDSNFFESGFIIERSANGSSFTFLDSVGKNQSSFTDNFIESENKYEYKIKSYSRFNVSSYSDIIKTEFLVTYSYDYDLIDHTDHVKWVKFSPIEDIIASAGLDKVIKIWSLSNKTLIRSISSDCWGGIVFNRAGTEIIAGGYDRMIRIFDINNGSLISTLGPHNNSQASGGISSMCIDGTGSIIASGGQDGNIKLWDLNSKTLIRTLTTNGNGAECIVISPDNSLIACANNSGSFNVWQLSDGSPLLSVNIPDAIRTHSIAFSPDGSKIVVDGSLNSTQNGNIFIYDVISGQLLQSISGHISDCLSVAFSYDGKSIVSAGGGGQLYIWESSTGRQLQSLNATGGGAEAYYSVDIDPFKLNFAVGTYTKKIRVLSGTGQWLISP